MPVSSLPMVTAVVGGSQRAASSASVRPLALRISRSLDVNQPSESGIVISYSVTNMADLSLVVERSTV